VSKQFLILKREKLFSFNKIGKCWYKDKEIDLIALNEQAKQILFAECKWRDKVDAAKVLEELKEKSQFVRWQNDKRKEYYAVFAKSVKEKIKEPNIFLFELKDLENFPRHHSSRL
jgi:AAA+ ATPase superfamily predicted ATPase